MDFITKVAMDLPIIRPIKEFIHLNLLLPYQHLHFWEALKKVSAKLEANPFPGLDYYRDKLNKGELPKVLLLQKLEMHLGDEAARALSFIMEGKFTFTHHDTRKAKLHDCWNGLIGFNVMELSDGMLIKWLSMFLDQGIGHWPMPHSSDSSFYDCICKLLNSSFIVPQPFRSKNLAGLFPATAEEAIESHLEFLCPEKKLRHVYTRESIMTLRGWAGLIYNIQKEPSLLPFNRKITLTDFLAVKLTLERAWIEHERLEKTFPDFSAFDAEFNPQDPIGKMEFLALRSCQEALEESTYDNFLRGILDKKVTGKTKAAYQAVFCMDDRESSLRIHLEEASPKIETFGTAGHFGIDCLYQHPEDAFPKKQCPAPVPAKFLLKDVATGAKEKRKNLRNLAFKYFQPSGNLLQDWLLSHLNAFSSIVKLSTNLFFPLAMKSLENVKEIDLDTEIKLHKDITQNEGGLPEGYTLEQMAELIHGQLILMGFVHDFASLIFIIGHGSKSENNPYFATYGCGACSGRAGAANARALVGMANDQSVRQLIREKYQLEIPPGTHFVAGMHDTCQDVVEFYNTRALPSHLLQEYKNFKKYLGLALYKNARERSKIFKLVTYRSIGKDAQKEVIRRSHSLFETRPEMGHTNVAFALVGKRETSKGVTPGKPSFFQSYDSSIDLDGKLLSVILGAVVPVCSGINLDYYFSRMDNLRFGAGSKLPQNIVGNFGVSHGTESDLLFGLPFQMIDQHQPLRLFVLVEQAPQVALSAIQDNPLVRQIVYNKWIHYASYDKSSKTIHLFEDGRMIPQERLAVKP